MEKTIRILILEHESNDSGLVEEELKKSGMNYCSQIVHTRKDYEKALSSFNPDIILADYLLPCFDGLSAFRIRQHVAPETPFIIVSGIIGEENAVELIRMGVTDYVLKGNLYQITAKIYWALNESSERQQKIVAEQLLRQREQQLRKIMDFSLDVICTLDQEGRFVTIGAACKAVWGYLPEELIGTRAIELVHQEDRERTWQAIADLRKGFDMVNFENRCFRKNGALATLFWSVHWDPQEQLGYVVARDATEIKKAQEKIRNNEKRFRTLLQNSTDGLTLVAADGTILERGPSSLKILGLDANEIVDKFRFDLINPDDLKAVREAFAQVKKNAREIITVEYRMLMPDGSYKWLETTFNNQLQEPAVGAIVLNYRNITERKVAEIALKTSEARLKKAQAIGHIGDWEMNWADGSTEWSDEIYRMFGVDKKAIQPSKEAFISFVHPEDRAAVLATIEQAMASLKNASMTFRILRPDGEVRYVTSEGHFEVDEEGKPIRFFGIQQDVTERKLADIALEKSEEKYRNLFRLSPTPMWVYDVKTLYFLDVNEAAIKHYGYSKEEFLNMTLPDIRPREEEAGPLEGIANTLKSAGVHYHYITKQIKKNGEVIDVDIKNSFVELGGRETRLVIATDISERIKYIQAVKEQNVKLREIAWTQSHVVRAPLARMMGLINMLQDYPPEEFNTTDLLSHLSASAHELDDIIREIVRKTELVQDQPILEEKLGQ